MTLYISAFSAKENPTLVVSHVVGDGGCVWSLTCATKLSNSSNLIEARHSSFLLSSHSHEVIPFARFF